MNFDSANVFNGTAWYYARYRRVYPKQIFADIVDYYQLNGKGCLLDLGCGTGEISVPLARYFENVIGVDPSSDMLAEARKRAKKQNVSNIHWLEGRAEDIEDSYSPIRLTTAGTSFHWMQQSLVLEKGYHLTQKSGGMVIIAGASPVRGKDEIKNWKVRRNELIAKYLGPHRRTGANLRKDFVFKKRPLEELVAESPFRTFKKEAYPHCSERNIDQVVGHIYSMPPSRKRLFGDRAGEFEWELRQELLKLVPSGKFADDVMLDVFFLRK